MNTQALLLIKTMLISGMLVLASFCMANDIAALKKASSDACNKIKMCIKKQVAEEQEMSPEMIKMIDQMAEQSCKSLYDINAITADDNLVQPVTKCYQAVAKRSCAELEKGDQPQACAELQKKVENM